MFELFKKLNRIEDIQKFIEPISTDPESQSRESNTIEYKEAATGLGSTNEVSKDISAFANSEGGLIFYGIKCDKIDRTKPLEVTGIKLSIVETFDQIVNSNIHHPIKGIQKKLIPEVNPQVMLVYVSQSDEAPHQNNDGKYYIRAGSESRHMPHYMVELYFGKRRSPKLSVQLNPIIRPSEQDFTDGWSPITQFHLSIVNSGKAIAKYVRAIFLFPTKRYINHLKSLEGQVTDINRLYQGREAWEYQENLGVIHPKLNQSTWRFQFQYHQDLMIDPEIEEQNPVLTWNIFADGMEPQTGKELLTSLFPR